MYTVFPDGSPVPQGMALYAPPPPLPNNSQPLNPGTVVYGPPPVGAPIVYGPPPPSFSVPLIPVGVLHCNVPEHHNLVSGKTQCVHGRLSKFIYVMIRPIYERVMSQVCFLRLAFRMEEAFSY